VVGRAGHERAPETSVTVAAAMAASFRSARVDRSSAEARLAGRASALVRGKRPTPGNANAARVNTAIPNMAGRLRALEGSLGSEATADLDRRLSELEERARQSYR
jgi:hypothetical protein